MLYGHALIIVADPRSTCGQGLGQGTPLHARSLQVFPAPPAVEPVQYRSKLPLSHATFSVMLVPPEDEAIVMPLMVLRVMLFLYAVTLFAEVMLSPARPLYERLFLEAAQLADDVVRGAALDLDEGDRANGPRVQFVAHPDREPDDGARGDEALQAAGDRGPGDVERPREARDRCPTVGSERSQQPSVEIVERCHAHNVQPTYSHCA